MKLSFDPYIKIDFILVPISNQKTWKPKNLIRFGKTSGKVGDLRVTTYPYQRSAPWVIATSIRGFRYAVYVIRVRVNEYIKQNE